MTENAALLQAMPYGESFRFVDVFDHVDDTGAEGRYRYPPESAFYADHFPGAPVTPGVILVETLAQIGLVGLGIFLTGAHRTDVDASFAFTGCEVSFLRPVGPGEEVTVRSQKVYFRMRKLKCLVEMTNARGERVCHGVLSGVVLPPRAS